MKEENIVEYIAQETDVSIDTKILLTNILLNWLKDVKEGENKDVW